MKNLRSQEIKEMYWEKKLSIRKIAKKLGVHHWTVWKLMVKSGIPRRPHKRIRLNKNDLHKLYWVEGLSARKIAKSLGVHHKTILDRLKIYGIPRRENYAPYTVKEVQIDDNEDLAYIFGVLDGDGWFGLDRGHYFLHLHVKDRDFAEEFASKLSKIFGRHIAVWRGGDGFWSVRHYVPKCFISLFRAYPTKAGNWVVPDFVMRGNRKVVANYVRGFADSEGSVNEAARTILLCNTNYESLKCMMWLLRTVIGLKYGKVSLVKKGLAIYGQKNLQIFSRVVGFSIKRKQEKLLRVLRSYDSTKKRKGSCCGEKILKELYWGKGWSTVDIAKEFRVTPGAVSCWMKKFNIPRRSLREYHHLRRQGCV